jgi:hypothetical protein
MAHLDRCNLRINGPIFVRIERYLPLIYILRFMKKNLLNWLVVALFSSFFVRSDTHNFSMNHDSPIRNLVWLPSPVQQEHPPPVEAPLDKVKPKRKCGLCGCSGHDRRNCPQKAQVGEFLLHFTIPCQNCVIKHSFVTFPQLSSFRYQC